MQETVEPLGKRVLVRQTAADEKTPGGILLPDSAKEKPQDGVIVQPLTIANEVGDRLRRGDRVIYSKYAGTQVNVGEEELLLLSVEDVVARITTDATAE